MKILQYIITFSILASCYNADFGIIIANGTIVDGSGQESYEADIGIVDDRIVTIGDLSKSKSTNIINAENLIVSPGFIDSHTHAIRGIFDVPTVTTVTDGNLDTSSLIKLINSYS